VALCAFGGTVGTFLLAGIFDSNAYRMSEEPALFDFFTERTIWVFETLFPGCTRFDRTTRSASS
jgi:hypothetical protein